MPSSPSNQIYRVMEKVTLKNGKVGAFIVTSNDTYKFYLCENNSDAEDLKDTLSGSELGFSRSLGWFVRVKK